MSDVRLSDDIVRLNHSLESELAGYRHRMGEFAMRLRHEQMGRSIVATFWRDGVESDQAPLVSLSPYVKTAYRLYGRTPFTVEIEVSESGAASEPRFEFERPPHADKLRQPALYVQELELRPRSPELVPGWMKVELAAVGAWDLRSDVPTWKDHEPTGEPQTPESVGMPPPPGAEWALTG
jgi:hypothetical protein